MNIDEYIDERQKALNTAGRQATRRIIEQVYKMISYETGEIKKKYGVDIRHDMTAALVVEVTRINNRNIRWHERNREST